MGSGYKKLRTIVSKDFSLMRYKRIIKTSSLQARTSGKKTRVGMQTLNCWSISSIAAVKQQQTKIEVR